MHKKRKSPQSQLAGFIAKFTPELAAVAHAALARMRRLLPGAVELVYDNYYALVIGFGPNERASDAIFSIALYPRWVNLFFLHGASLSDPENLLKGSGKVVRHIVLESVATLDKPAIRALMGQALQAAKPLDAKCANRIVIKCVSSKQRPRRPPAERKGRSSDRR